ncbi:MAG: hypothetical protein AABX04_00550 [Nanoarchaeota archaeon]
MRTIRRGLIALLTAGTLAVSYFGCSSSGSSSCGSDKDCNRQNNEVCIEHQCVPYQSPTETPQQVFDLWAEAFINNDLEGSLQYFDPGKSEIYRNWLTNQEFLIKRGIIPPEGLLDSEVLPYIARQIQGAALVPIAVKGNYFEYRLDKSCTSKLDCPKQAACIDSKCNIDQRIILVPMYDKSTQKVVYKIGSF